MVLFTLLTMDLLFGLKTQGMYTIVAQICSIVGEA
jgi:hypothetical protein